MVNDTTVVLREVLESDLPVFFEHQSDPIAARMANFPSRDLDAFYAHWHKILADEVNFLRTILYNGQVAGNIVSFIMHDEREVGYWVGRDYWGKGITTRALQLFLPIIKGRPLYGFTTEGNVASQKVLSNCGFKLLGNFEGLLKFEFL